eukprot:Nk52_evm3s659 gene=Nk52_evmTU3s659
MNEEEIESKGSGGNNIYTNSLHIQPFISEFIPAPDKDKNNRVIDDEPPNYSSACSCVSAEDLFTYLSLEHAQIQVNQPKSKYKSTSSRPYVWTMSLTSVDGITSLTRPGATVYKDAAVGNHNHGTDYNENTLGVVGLREEFPLGSGTDYRLLCLGWGMADAIVASASSLRCEKDTSYDYGETGQEDLRRAGEKEKKRRRLATTGEGGEEGKGWEERKGGVGAETTMLVVLTRSGEVDLSHRAFQGNRKVLIVTGSETVKERLLEEKATKIMRASARVSGSTHSPSSPSSRDSNNNDNPFVNGASGVDAVDYTAMEVLCIAPLFASSSSGSVCLRGLMEVLHQRYGVRYVDVSAGAEVCTQLLQLGLIDEIRVTMAGHVCGNSTSGSGSGGGDVAGAMLSRPELFRGEGTEGEGPMVFDAGKSPLVLYEGIRVIRPSHLFYRASLRYRHDL